MAKSNPTAGPAFPAGQEYDRYVKRRQRRAKTWHGLFFAATLVGILALVALLLDVVNDAFGYVAIQSKVPESTLVSTYFKDEVLAARRTLTSEDDQALVDNVATRDTAIGFFGYSYYAANTDKLAVVAIDGIKPDAASVADGTYPLARPLYIYTTVETLQAKPQVAAFVGYLLDHVNQVIGDVGYFPVSEAALAESKAQWQAAAAAPDAVASAGGEVLSVGSSTVAPIIERMALDIQTTAPAVKTTIENIGTDAGIRAFCLENHGDLLNASRALTETEEAACSKEGRKLIRLQVANDGIAVVIHPENTFAATLSMDQLKAAFTSAEEWSDLDPAWPSRPILHFIPGADSGTLDFFSAEVFGVTLDGQQVEDLTAMIKANLSSGRVRALEATTPLMEQPANALVELVRSEIVKPTGAGSWSLFESLTRRAEIAAEVAEMPDTELQFRSWINKNFLTSAQSSDPYKAGISIAILGSLWVTIIAFFMAVPLGIAAAIYLEEYSSGKSRLDQIIETNINNLAGVPSIIYGMLGLAVFVRFMSALTSGQLFGYGDPSTTNGRTILSAGLTLGLLILPLVIINAREAIRAVPRGLREASYGLGATRWQTVWNHVLPSSMSGILTGVILAVSRAFGETAPLIVVGVSTFIVVQPDGPFSKFTTLTAQIYQWTSRPQEEFQHLAAAAILVLLVLLVTLNAAAIYLRTRYAKAKH